MMTSSLERFQPSDDVVAREVGGEMVLLDLVSGLYFGLNPAGTKVWERLGDGAASLAELADSIEEAYDAPRELIESDLAALLEQLAERKLIEPV